MTHGRSLEFEEALESEENQQWLDVMQDEMKSLHNNHTYDLVKLYKGKMALENRWIFKVKQDVNSTLRHKARLVVKMSFIITVLNLATTLDLEI